MAKKLGFCFIGNEEPFKDFDPKNVSDWTQVLIICEGRSKRKPHVQCGDQWHSVFTSGEGSREKETFVLRDDLLGMC